VGDCILDANLSPIKIASVTFVNTAKPVEFLHICTLKNHNFFLNGFLSHNMEVRMLNTANGTEFSLNVTESDTI
jgi:hypothetical protein